MEIGFETELNHDEIFGIMNAVRMKESFYRLKDGSFISVDDENAKKFKVLESLNFLEKDIKSNQKNLSKYYALYLEALKTEGIVTTDGAFDELIKSVKNISAEIPVYLTDVLRDYQVKGVNWIKQLSELGFGGILADDM